MALETIDLTGDNPAPLSQSNKRKRKAPTDHVVGPSRLGSKNSIDLTQDDKSTDDIATMQGSQPKKKRKAKATEVEPDEKRLKRHREKLPSSLKGVYDRAVNQRMFCLDRQRAELSETLKIAGSTGNVYTVTIGKLPTCDCPHARKGNECKHVLFALVKVLKTKDYWQKAYVESELKTIFDEAPPIIPVNASETDGTRKPVSDDDNCPICFEALGNNTEATVYCKAACGNNIHKECFEQWAASRRRSGAPVSCPFCRSRWATGDGPQGSVSMETLSQRQVTGEGYVNVAEQLGISGQRDYNSYHSFWVARQARDGVDVGDWVDPRPERRGRYGD